MKDARLHGGGTGARTRSRRSLCSQPSDFMGLSFDIYVSSICASGFTHLDVTVRTILFMGAFSMPALKFFFVSKLFPIP